MPVITPSQLRDSYDVIVVGSGAAGGQTAYTLALQGAKVLMLEAGRDYDPRSETPMFETNFQAPLRGRSTPDKPFGFYDSTVDGGWEVPGEPYTQASDDPARQFRWWRARMTGGRTNHWGRISLRNGVYDFKPHSRDGLGFDWPLGYDDVAPYYDKVERLIGVYGSNEGLENTPDSPAGVLQPPPKFRAGELYVQKHAKGLGLPVIPIHRAVLTQRQDGNALAPKLFPGNATAQRLAADGMNSRAACFWATPCGRGCSIGATYQSTIVHIPPALASGNMDLVANAMTREVLMNDEGKATGVLFIDRTTRTEFRVRARIVVLAASSAESVRILLNSKSRRPEGVANSSGLVGKYIMDTVGARLAGQIPAFENMPAYNEDGAGGDHAYVPWWLYKEQLAGAFDFARGYHIEFSTGRRMPDSGTAAGLEWLNGGTYGKKFKEDARRYYGSFLQFSGRGEMIPNEDSFCDLDPSVKDIWGIPVLRFHWKWSSHEINQVRHMHQTFARIFEALGGRLRTQPVDDGAKAIQPGGEIIHEVGGTIMGASSSKSVTNHWCQTWDVKNLFVTDGGPFCSNADKNPTLTIMALAWRSADFMLDEMRKGNL